SIFTKQEVLVDVKLEHQTICPCIAITVVVPNHQMNYHCNGAYLYN
ncbi:17146_t:CDS:1, partial [Racocetra persica]